MTSKWTAFLIVVTGALTAEQTFCETPKVFKNRAELEAYVFAPKPNTAPPNRTPIENSQVSDIANFKGIFDRRLANLKKLESDPSAYLQAIASIRQELASKKAELFRRAQTTAYHRFGVPDLERQLQRNKIMDRNSSAYVRQYGDTDSDETAYVRSRLLEARVAADNSIPTLLNGDGEYQTLEAYADTLNRLHANKRSGGASPSKNQPLDSQFRQPRAHNDSRESTPSTRRPKLGGAEDTVGNATEIHPLVASEARGDGFRQDGYGPGIHTNQYGQAVTVKPVQGDSQGEQLVIQPNAYGPGIHSDQYGRQLKEVPFGQ